MVPVTVHPIVRRFIESLEAPEQTKVAKEIDSLTAFGRALPPPYAKKLEDNLFELRIRGKVAVRLLYGFIDTHAIVVHGFVKKSNKIPMRELETARQRLAMLAAQ